MIYKNIGKSTRKKAQERGEIMKTVRVTYANGDTIITGINGTRAEVERYFAIGKKFNLATGAAGDELDNMQAVTKLDFLTI